MQTSNSKNGKQTKATEKTKSISEKKLTNASINKKETSTVAVNQKVAKKPEPKKVEAKPEPKATKVAATKPSKQVVNGTSENAMVKTKKGDKETNFIIGIIVVILLLCLTAGIIFPIRLNNDRINNKLFTNPYKTLTEVGFEAEQLGTVKRNIPTEVKNEGMSSAGYPTYGTVLNMTQAQKGEIIKESNFLCAKPTQNASGVYEIMDKDGFLYYGNRTPVNDANGNQRQLYKHTASVGLYGGNVADTEPAVIKKLTMRKRGYNGYAVTGLYAPAGEVIKIEISEADMNLTGGLTIHIGQALFNGQANNIWAQRNIKRMPVILNTMNVNKTTATLENGVYTAYVGSYLGGPIYVRNNNAPIYSVTISGGVNYSHFILGYTTEEEFNKNAESSAPYFDLEVWDYGVLHSGPKQYAKAFNYDDIYKAAVLWDKISLVSNATRGNNKQGIVFLYDPFVAAGAAVAFPGRRSVNCPAGWMSSALNYKSFISNGSWGNMHEYNHNFQGWGLPGGGEVTNNSLNLVEYSLFTKISSNRKIGNFGAEGLSGWNNYTVASWALAAVLNGSVASTSQLSIYATMLHNFGQDNFINARGSGIDGYFTRFAEVTHNDMTYFSDLYAAKVGSSSYAMSATAKQTIADKNYPMFVPVSCVYQTGRSYMYDSEKRYIETMQPYAIKYGEDFTIDLNAYTTTGGVNKDGQYTSGSVVIPEGFSYTIKNVTQPEHGTITQDGKILTFKPDKNLRSGKIYVTLGITKNDGAFDVQDVDLVLEFEQSHEMNKNMLERTTYTYAAGSAYTDAEEAYASNYAGYESVVAGDNINASQNSNTDVWYTYTEPAPDNSVVEVKGKIYIEETGKYRIAFRGRWNCALYISTDNGKTYELAGKYKKAANAEFQTDKDKDTYVDLELEEKTWVYFKEVMICHSVPNSRGRLSSFVGVGIAKFEVPTYTIRTEEIDDPSGEIDPATGEVKKIYVDHYFNSAGVEVSAEQANDTTPKTPTNSQIAYANAYRSTYEFAVGEFESDYFYTRIYNYSYTDNNLANTNQTLISNSAYSPWSASQHQMSNLVDGNKNTYIHTRGGHTEAKPFEFVIDMGEEKYANRMIIYSQSRSDLQIPKSFKLYGSLDGEEFFEVGNFENVPNSATITVNFDRTSFRYYKLSISKSSNKYIIISEIELWDINEVLNGTKVSPESKNFIFKGRWETESTMSSFGHVYKGKKDASLEFEFEGNRLAVLSNSKLCSNFEVYIDNVKMQSIELKEDTSLTVASFISNELTNGKHKVRIKCTGNASIDSIVYWKAAE